MRIEIKKETVTHKTKSAGAGSGLVEAELEKWVARVYADGVPRDWMIEQIPEDIPSTGIAAAFISDVAPNSGISPSEIQVVDHR